jgi:hypothetical protein
MSALSDDELEQIMTACKPLAVKDRDPFLRALAAEIAKYPKIGLGACARSPVVT